MKKEPKATRHHRRLRVGPEELARQLADLRYDGLAQYLRCFAAALQVDGGADRTRGRALLANRLENAATDLSSAAHAIELAWKMCEPKMKATSQMKDRAR